MVLPYGIRSFGWTALSGTYHKRNRITSVASPPTGGTWTFTISGQTATGLAHNITAASLQTALEALSNVAPGDVTCTMLVGTDLSSANAVIEIVWGGAFANTNPTTSANFGGLTGGTAPTLTETVRQTIALGSGPGMTVKGHRIGMSCATSLDTLTVHSRFSVGFGDGTTDRAVGFFGEDGSIAANTNSGTITDSGACVSIPGTGSSTPIARARTISCGTDSIVIEWLNGYIPTSSFLGRVTFVMGPSASAKVVSFAGSSSNNTAQSSPSLGFQADGGWVITGGNAFGDASAASEGMFCFGSFGRLSSRTQWCAAICGEDAESNTSSGALIRNDRVALKLASAAKTVSETVSLELTAIGSDTIEVTTRTAGVALEIAVLAFSIGGKKVLCDVPTPTTSSAGSKSITTPGYFGCHVTIVGMRVGSVGTINSGVGGGGIGVGEYDVGGTGAIGGIFRDNQTTGDAASETSNTYALTSPLTGTTRETRGNVTALTATGFDITIETASAADRPMPYMFVEYPTIAGTFDLAAASAALDLAGSERMNGVLDLAAAAPALDFAGAERMTGVLDLAAAVPALDLSGSERMTGTFDLAAAAPALDFVAQERMSGAFALEVQAPALDFAGSVTANEITGTFALAVEAPALDFDAQERMTGTFDVAVQAPALDATGQERMSGTFVLEVQAPALDLAGAERIAGALELAAPAPDLDFDAQERIAGAFDLAAQAPALDLAGASNTETTGTLELRSAAPALDFVGYVHPRGQFALEAAAPELAFAGQLRITGTFALRAAAPALDLAGAERIAGAVALRVRAPELTFSGSETIAGAVTVRVRAPALDFAGSIATNVTGSFALRAAAPALSIAGSVPVSAVRVELLGSFVSRVALLGSHVPRVTIAGSFGD